MTMDDKLSKCACGAPLPYSHAGQGGTRRRVCDPCRDKREVERNRARMKRQYQRKRDDKADELRDAGRGHLVRDEE